MSLTELWQEKPEQLSGKQVQQIIAFAGAGRLRDGSVASAELRDYLRHVDSDDLQRYLDNCLTTSFSESGLALQDLVNEIGRRLGLAVTPGRYRGVKGEIGFDGLWILPSGHAIVVEVKTTDAYRIDLAVPDGYRRALAKIDKLSLESSSILIVVGRKDTGDLEAQIRGSRHGWDTRLISADAVLRLLRLKESLEDPHTVGKIHELLVPREFTRLDAIVDLVFSAAEEVKEEDELEEVAEVITSSGKKTPPFTPSAFHKECVSRVSAHLGKTLVRHTRATYSTPDESLYVICAVSKRHERGGGADNTSYWFAFHSHQRALLEKAGEGYVAFGCGGPERIVLIPYKTFAGWLDGLWTTEKDDRMYWHVRFNQSADVLKLNRRKGMDDVDVTTFLLRGEAHEV